MIIHLLSTRYLYGGEATRNFSLPQVLMSCLFFFSLFFARPWTVLAQVTVNADLILVSVDASEAMNRRWAEASPLPMKQSIQQVLSQELFNINSIPNESWISMRILGGVRTGINRSCDLTNQAGQYYSYKIPTTWNRGNGWNFCNLSEWTTTGYANGSPFFSYWNGLYQNIKPSDYSLIGKGFADHLRDVGAFLSISGNRRIRALLITDGGESCNRQSNRNNDPLAILRRTTFNGRSVINNRLTLWVVLVNPISLEDQARMQRIVDAVNNIQPGRAYRDNSVLTVANDQAQLAQSIAAFRLSQVGAAGTFYDPSATCAPAQ